MHPSKSSKLLPDLFKHKTNEVRVSKPRVILIDFHGTMSERHWEDKVIFPYVKQAVNRYLKTNWYNDAVQQCFFGLRDESFEQRFRNKYEDAPVISDITRDGQEVETDQLIGQVSDFVVWQMDNKKGSKETKVIERLVWRDGLSKNELKVPIYEDVLPCMKRWRGSSSCKIYVTSSLEEDILKLLLSKTNHGDLTSYIDGYVCSQKAGEKMMSEFYERTLTLSGMNIAQGPRILFLTDSGQEAKAASQVANGKAFECLIVCRPGNKAIRTYYLSKFSYIEKFTDLTLVDIT